MQITKKMNINHYKMKDEYEINYWNELKLSMLDIFPSLTDADLDWRDNAPEDMLSLIANKLGKTKKQVKDKIDSHKPIQ